MLVLQQAASNKIEEQKEAAEEIARADSSLTSRMIDVQSLKTPCNQQEGVAYDPDLLSSLASNS
jgi:hypothetical protein